MSLLLLAWAAFAYNTSESFPVGLLPEMSRDLGVSEAWIGGLLTLYAAVVAVTVLPLVAVTSGVARRRLVLVTVGVLALSNAAMAFAPGYPLVVASRLVSATTHGVFWSIVAPTAAMLVPRGREGFATAIAFTGSSLAMVAGIPLATAVGGIWGWRTAILALGGTAAVALVGLALVLPPLEVRREVGEAGEAGTAGKVGESGTAREAGTAAVGAWEAVRSTVRNRRLLWLCALTVLVVTAYFATYTYIALFLDRDAGVRGDTLAPVLLLYGLAGLVAIWVIGRTTDRWPQWTGLGCTAALGVALLGMGVFASWAPAGVVGSVLLLGAAFTATPVFLQATVLRVAPTASDVASSVYVVAFQIGIAGGALLGGLAVNADTMGVIPWVAGAVVLGALLLERRVSRGAAAADARVPITTGQPR